MPFFVRMYVYFIHASVHIEASQSVYLSFNRNVLSSLILFVHLIAALIFQSAQPLSPFDLLSHSLLTSSLVHSQNLIFALHSSCTPNARRRLSMISGVQKKDSNFSSDPLTLACDQQALRVRKVTYFVAVHQYVT